uniref:BTB domain-containing protein n=1 Tax=Opuntia streptacantha TaxID=393608 RepID=A0A7C9DFT2_OPUST
MAATADCDDDTVVIECRDPNLIETVESTSLTEIFILADDISSWDLSTILSHDIIKVKINRSRLIQESSYFQSLLSGNFSESSMHCFPIKWSSRMFLHILRFMHGYHLEVTFCSFLPLYHTALYFGLEKLMSECKSWFSDILERRVSSSQLQFDDLIHVWDFGYEQAIDWIVEPCTSYVAKNFVCTLRGTFVKHY